MKLYLEYNNKSTQESVKGAFLRGSDPLLWLQEIDKWNMLEEEMEFYLLPQSIHTVQAAGLFIIFKNTSKVASIELLDPYTSVGQKLFIPVSTILAPKVSETELKHLLLWQYQIFHPSIGIIGLENKDKIELTDLFVYNDFIYADWSFAHPGIFNRPVFSEINIIQPTTEEMIESVKKEIGEKLLKDIPKKKGDGTSIADQIGDKIKWGILKGISSVMNVVAKILPEQGDNGTYNGNEGLLQKLQQWVMKNLGELDAKRNAEIRRLLNLFDENSNEALQYAIPLHSPYLNRGSRQISEKLTKRSLQFNLGKLGGGELVDGWEIGDHYNNLRTKYLRAAEKEIEKKDFKKAAYVYAHLLGDFHSAANTLEQGKMHREAASLYKDHLKNLAAAAECLERGGLYLEAIEVNKQLNKDEKVGDLYSIVKQHHNAEQHYEKYIATKISQNDYLDAGRVINEKLEQKERAKQIFLDGWVQTYQVEPCLKKYFDLVQATETEGSLKNSIRYVYTKHAPKHKKIPFLNVLEQVSKKNKDELLQSISQEIAYEIIHDEVANGNIQMLHRLKSFLPEDKLVGFDASRYASSNNSRLIKMTDKIITLDDTIKWIKCLAHKNQMLVIGIKDGFLHLARLNWYGNIEYYSWSNHVKTLTSFTFIDAPYYTNNILLHSTGVAPVTRKNLPKNKYFNDSLVVYCPIWLHKGTAQFIIDEDEAICKIEITRTSITLHYYTLDGTLKKSIPCIFEESLPELSHVTSNSLTINNKGYYYTYSQKAFFIVSKKGIANAFSFNTVIRFFSSSSGFSDFYIVVSTNSGCLLYKPSEGQLNLQGNFFAIELIPSAICFIAADSFIILEKTTSYLFKIVEGIPVKTGEYQADSKLIGAVSTSVRNQFALLEENGKITMYSF